MSFPDSSPRVRVERACKQYRRGAAAYGSLRDSLGRLLTRASRAGQQVTALEEVSLVLQAGEVFGVIGDNGAGKSTLLKVLARITPLDRGRVEIRGRLSALIELGAGFHPELTGRENVLLHGSILGLARRTLRAAMDGIADFAGLVGAMDTPVKYFSTGMYARLGFAVAVFADPEVLLIDEVLSVGDVAFREKCYRRIQQLTASGTAILFVSHDLPTIESLCKNALLLERGRPVRDGPAPAVVAHYRSLSKKRTGQPPRE